MPNLPRIDPTPHCTTRRRNKSSSRINAWLEATPRAPIGGGQKRRPMGRRFFWRSSALITSGNKHSPIASLWRHWAPLYFAFSILKKICRENRNPCPSCRLQSGSHHQGGGGADLSDHLLCLRRHPA